MEKFKESIKPVKREKIANLTFAAIAAISMFIGSACKVMLPDSRVMSRSEYVKKRDAARKKCENLLPEHLKRKDFEDIYCNPCARKFKVCIDEEFKLSQ